MKKTKIIATIGPSSWPIQTLTQMYKNGMNAVRVNGAFADNEELKKVSTLARSISDKIILILDIKGHEVRLNRFDEPLKIKKGDEVVIGSSIKDAIYPVTYPVLYKDLTPGIRLLLDDGNVILEVTKIQNQKIHTKVILGSLLKPAKGMNIPGVKLSNPPLTERDIEQIKFCIKDGWDYVAESFVRNREDVLAIKKYTDGSHMKIIAKIEDLQGVENFDEILEEVEGVMVARGDLGIEVPYERLPMLQKGMIKKCNAKGKPVITATQMLESMIEKPFATRAEISDVANSIIDGTDVIMLSSETSAGAYPAEAVETMRRIAVETEKYIKPKLLDDVPAASEITNATTKAAFEICTSLDIDAVIAVTRTGRTARILSRFKIKQPIYTFVSQDYYMRRMNLSRGVYPFTYNAKYKDRDAALNAIIKEAVDRKLVKKTHKVLVIGNAAKAIDREVYFPNIFEIVEIGKFLQHHK